MAKLYALSPDGSPATIQLETMNIQNNGGSYSYWCKLPNGLIFQTVTSIGVIATRTWLDFILPIAIPHYVLGGVSTVDSRDYIDGLWTGRNNNKTSVAMYIQSILSNPPTESDVHVSAIILCC